MSNEIKKFAAAAKVSALDQEVTPLHQGGTHDDAYTDALHAIAESDESKRAAVAAKFAAYYNDEEWLKLA